MGHILKHFHQSALFKLAVKAGLTLLAFWFVFRGIDFDLLRDMLHKQDHKLLLTAVACFLLQTIIGSVRWRLILKAVSEAGNNLLGYVSALKVYYISMFFACCLPGTVGGDVIRVWLTKSENVPLHTAIHSVIIDRLIALVALSTMIIVTLPVLGSIVGFNPIIIFVIVAVLAIAGILFLMNLERLIGHYRHIRIVSWILYFLDSLRLILRRRTASLQSFAIALCTHMFYCIGVYILAQSFHISISLIQCIVLSPPVLLATTIPISIGGWGIREAGTIGMLGLIGVPQAQALMLSIQIGIVIIVNTLPASILWLLYRKRSPQQPLHMDHANAAGNVQ